METLLNFLADYYLYFMIAAGVLFFALIGFLVDANRKKNKGTETNANVISPEPQAVNDDLNIQNQSAGVDSNLVQPMVEMPKEINEPESIFSIPVQNTNEVVQNQGSGLVSDVLPTPVQEPEVKSTLEIIEEPALGQAGMPTLETKEMPESEPAMVIGEPIQAPEVKPEPEATLTPVQEPTPVVIGEPIQAPEVKPAPEVTLTPVQEPTPVVIGEPTQGPTTVFQQDIQK